MRRMAWVGLFTALGALAGTGSSAQTRELTPSQRAALERLSGKLEEVDFHPTAVPSWLMGDLGPADADPGSAALAVVQRVADVYRMTPDDGFTVRSVRSDDVGQVHVRLQQTYRGLPVLGGELIVHIEED